MYIEATAIVHVISRLLCIASVVRVGFQVDNLIRNETRRLLRLFVALFVGIRTTLPNDNSPKTVHPS